MAHRKPEPAKLAHIDKCELLLRRLRLCSEEVQQARAEVDREINELQGTLRNVRMEGGACMP
eukprot:5634563-Amphidinium_carterae.1